MGHSTDIPYIHKGNIDQFFDALAAELINLTGPRGRVSIGVCEGSYPSQRHFSRTKESKVRHPTNCGVFSYVFQS